MRKKIVQLVYTTLITALFLFVLYLPNLTFFHAQKKNELDIFVWANFFSTEAIHRFEKETGTKVNLHFFADNEDMLVKLRNTPQHHFDMIFSSDYATKTLAEEGYLRSIQKDRLNFIPRIESFLLGREYDPTNRYAIPYLWEVSGIAVNPDEIPSDFQPNLERIFNTQRMNYTIVIPPDPIEITRMAAQYLFKTEKNLTPNQINQIRALLKAQKVKVEAYSEFRAKYLVATENCPVAIVRSSSLPELKVENPKIQYHLPTDGIFTSIENATITTACKNEDAAYAFLNFIYQPEIIALSIDLWPLFPTDPSALKHLQKPLAPEYYEIYHATRKRQAELLFFSYFIPTEEMRKIWVDIKS